MCINLSLESICFWWIRPYYLSDKCEIGTISWSDHAPIIFSLHLTPSYPTPFTWKNNTYLFMIPEHQKFISQKLSKFFTLNSPSTDNHFTLWNAHKAYIRGILIQIFSRLKKVKTQVLDDLFHQIKLLEGKMQASPTASLHKDLLDARLALRQHLINEYENQLKRTKVAHYSLMNKPSRLMARRVAAVRHKTKIHFLFTPQQTHKIYNPQDIANAFSNFYSKLYNLKDDPHTPLPTSANTTPF